MRVSTFQNANWAKNQLMDLNVREYHRNQVTSGRKPSYE